MKIIYLKLDSELFEAFERQTVSDECFPLLGIKKCSHKEHANSDGCVSVKVIDVQEPYYLKAMRYPNGHLVYLASEIKIPWRFDPCQMG